jgi:hypothetical protein
MLYYIQVTPGFIKVPQQHSNWHSMFTVHCYKETECGTQTDICFLNPQQKSSAQRSRSLLQRTSAIRKGAREIINLSSKFLQDNGSGKVDSGEVEETLVSIGGSGQVEDSLVGIYCSHEVKASLVSFIPR